MRTKKVVISMSDKVLGFHKTTLPRVYDLIGYSYLTEFPDDYDLSSIVDIYKIPGSTARLWDDDRDRLMTDTEISDFD